ncbi:MAG TPA: hypothetical protein VFD10_05790 [Atribacterota bacterium]|nr:hypothetical protein [Atribacterota bacterium]
MSLIKIRIGNNERQFDDVYNVDESWINQQINKHREDKEKVCVRVYIKNEFIDILLTTPACGGGGGSGRGPNPQEREILNLWNIRGLNEEKFSGGNLISFFKQLRKIIG